MMRQKIKQVWKAAPSGVKHVVGIAAGVAGFLLESAADDDNDELSDSQGAFYNQRTGKYDDGHDLCGIYYDDFPPDDHRHYDR
jgi:hypothetical protein